MRSFGLLALSAVPWISVFLMVVDLRRIQAAPAFYPVVSSGLPGNSLSSLTSRQRTKRGNNCKETCDSAFTSCKSQAKDDDEHIVCVLSKDLCHKDCESSPKGENSKSSKTVPQESHKKPLLKVWFLRNP